MDHKALARDIIDNVGGEENIIDLTYCVSRLRFRLKDDRKANTAYLRTRDGIISVVITGGQYQVVIGQKDVDAVYKEILAITNLKPNNRVSVLGEPKKNYSLLDRIKNIFK